MKGYGGRYRVSIKKPLRVSGLKICGGEGTSIEHLLALFDFLSKLKMG